MALGTKEDGHFAEVEVVEGKEEELIIFKGLYSPNLFVRSSQVWTKVLIINMLLANQIIQIYRSSLIGQEPIYLLSNKIIQYLH